MNCEKTDESDELLNENPEISVHLNDENIFEKGIDVSSVTMSKTKKILAKT